MQRLAEGWSQAQLSEDNSVHTLSHNVDHVVVGDAVDELVVGINARQSWLLIDVITKVLCSSLSFSFFR
jgi:hypothetical protein